VEALELMLTLVPAPDGFMDDIMNGGRIEVAQRMAGHSNANTTGLYDRRNDDISAEGVERIPI
jgi:hypothetical protein